MTTMFLGSLTNVSRLRLFFKPGIESAIGALQCGNGLKRCRDKTELGFERYLALAILGRNLHTLGKRLLTIKHDASLAAQSKRKAA